MAILLAFCCLGFAAINDFIFKLYARKKRSRGVFVFAVGIVYTLLVSLLPDWWGRSYLATLGWGLLCGIFSVVGNFVLRMDIVCLACPQGRCQIGKRK